MRETTELVRHRIPRYVAVPPSLLMDKRLSFKAKGLFCTVLALPEYKKDGTPYDFSVNGMTSICKEGKDAIYAALKELRDAGWLLMYQKKDDDGKFGCTVYDFLPEPVELIPETDNAKSGNSLTEEPYRENPHTDYPDTENPPQNNNIIKSNLEENKKSSSSSCVCEDFVRKGAMPNLTKIWIEELQMMIQRFTKVILTDADVKNHYEDFKAQETSNWTDDHAETYSDWRRHYTNYLRSSIERQESNANKIKDKSSDNIAKGSFMDAFKETDKMIEENKQLSYAPDWIIQKHGKKNK